MAQRAELVRIDHESILDCVDLYDTWSALGNTPPDTIGNPNNAERAAALALASVAINFTSGWHDIISKRPGLSGAVSMVTRLTDYEHATGAFTPERLQRITVDDCSQIFEQHRTDPAIDWLLRLLAAALNDLGRLGAEHGSFVEFITAANQSAVQLATMLGEREPWHDVATHAGEPVAFYKRAQMAPATLARTFGGVGLGIFNDLDQLTIFADNLVPHVLRMDMVLTYDNDLLETIDQRQLLEHGGQAEVEIRACAVAAAELLINELGRAGYNVIAADLDHVLWSRGGAPGYKNDPRHRCRNPFY